MTTLHVGDVFATFDLAEKAVEDFCKANFHPIRRDSRETIKSINKKLSDEGKITGLDDNCVSSCR